MRMFGDAERCKHCDKPIWYVGTCAGEDVWQHGKPPTSLGFPYPSRRECYPNTLMAEPA